MIPLTLSVLKGFVPFHAFDDARLEILLGHCSRLYARKGQVLIAPGMAQTRAYFLLSGAVLCTESGKRITPAFAFPLHYQRQGQELLVAATDCSLFQIDRDVLDKLLCWSEAAKYLEEDIACQRQFDEHQEWMSLLLKSNLFHKVSPLNLQKVFMHLYPVRVKKGEVIIRQGDVGDCCYVIRQGQAAVTRRVSDSDSNVLLANIGVGRCFGEDALIHEAVRNATITMSSDGLLMRMDKRDFVQLLKEPTVDTLMHIDLDMGLQTGSILLDVRRPEEYHYRHLKGALSMPLASMRLQGRMLDQYGCYVVYCDTERRSRAAAHFLGQHGLRVRALSGGLNSLPPDFYLLPAAR